MESIRRYLNGRRAKMHDYKTDITLGERYRDEQTGIEGTATAVTFFQYACERVSIEVVIEGKIEEYTFDSPRLTNVKSGVAATTEKTGGPDRGTSFRQRGSLGRGSNGNR